MTDYLTPADIASANSATVPRVARTDLPNTVWPPAVAETVGLAIIREPSHFVKPPVFLNVTW